MATNATARKKKVVAGAKYASLAQLDAHAPESLITFRVSVLAQQLSRLVDASVREGLGLSSRQWRVLVILKRLGRATSGEVARLASFDHSQVSRVAYELVQMGLATQQDDPVDRRKQLLALTAAGIETLRKGIPGSIEREKRLRGRLTKVEYEVFCRVLQVLGEESRTMLRQGDSGGEGGAGRTRRLDAGVR